jgi:uncharacterized membrane protein YphA (DoxX/SURF4 family)
MTPEAAMTAESRSIAPPTSRRALWAGWVLSLLPALLLVFSASMKLIGPPFVVESFAHLGWPERSVLPLGILELSCALLFLIPRTAVLGAILIAGYMGGAIATHARIGEPFLTQAGVGVLAWLGLYLREPRLRGLIPLRRPAR